MESGLHPRLSPQAQLTYALLRSQQFRPDIHADASSARFCALGRLHSRSACSTRRSPAVSGGLAVSVPTSPGIGSADGDSTNQVCQ